MHVAPSRDMPWANRISHWNTWWKYYHHLAAYVAALLLPVAAGPARGRRADLLAPGHRLERAGDLGERRAA